LKEQQWNALEDKKVEMAVDAAAATKAKRVI
jgi:hypothetical protein